MPRANTKSQRRRCATIVAIGRALSDYITANSDAVSAGLPPEIGDPTVPVVDGIRQFATLLQTEPALVCRTSLRYPKLLACMLENVGLTLQFSDPPASAFFLKTAEYVRYTFPYLSRHCGGCCTPLGQVAITELGAILNFMGTILALFGSFLPTDPPFSAFLPLVNQLQQLGNALAADRSCCLPPSVGAAVSAVAAALAFFSASPVGQTFGMSVPSVLFSTILFRLVPCFFKAGDACRDCASVEQAAQNLVAASLAFQGSGILDTLPPSGPRQPHPLGSSSFFRPKKRAAS